MRSGYCFPAERSGGLAVSLAGWGGVYGVELAAEIQVGKYFEGVGLYEGVAGVGGFGLVVYAGDVESGLAVSDGGESGAAIDVEEFWFHRPKCFSFAVSVLSWNSRDFKRSSFEVMV